MRMRQVGPRQDLWAEPARRDRCPAHIEPPQTKAFVE